MTPPRIRGTSVSISTPAPRALAEFYARLLDLEITVAEGAREGEPVDAGWAQIRPVEGRLDMTLNFEWDEHYVPPAWPTPAPSHLGWPSVSGEVSAGPAPQQVMAHLDLWAEDLSASVAWAIECGATEHPHQPQENVRVMVDPHGHPFCLFT
ncbi:VOC family protein [Ornithinimicrobium ciconiae]|uniref:VOC family protein n=1 Tax=Ornithinimicrobium ciconiae TaxID=2594265 RepID=A0A516G712_9MICO|nr:VOC family protein [Ornithinimicrobium ciconiae]QDO87311.1 VOC family protein [Ornithinimicrobium ciconiae]